MSLEGLVVLAMVAATFAFVRRLCFGLSRLLLTTARPQVNDHVDLHLTQFKTIPCYLALFILAE